MGQKRGDTFGSFQYPQKRLFLYTIKKIVRFQKRPKIFQGNLAKNGPNGLYFQCGDRFNLKEQSGVTDVIVRCLTKLGQNIFSSDEKEFPLWLDCLNENAVYKTQAKSTANYIRIFED